MKKINLKGITEILSEKEMKNVTGGYGVGATTSDCRADCGVEITNCNGTCTATATCVKCIGATETLEKCCN